jgi:hypothetical protein
MRVTAAIRMVMAGLLAVVLSGCGCNGANRDAVNVIAKPLMDGFTKHIEESAYEWLRQEMLREAGPLIVASIVAASAPPGGPPPLSTLCADAGWRMAIAGPESGLKLIPSPLDTPKPGVQPFREIPIDQ